MNIQHKTGTSFSSYSSLSLFGAKSNKDQVTPPSKICFEIE